MPLHSGRKTSSYCKSLFTTDVFICIFVISNLLDVWNIWLFFQNWEWVKLSDEAKSCVFAAVGAHHDRLHPPVCVLLPFQQLLLPSNGFILFGSLSYVNIQSQCVCFKCCCQSYGKWWYIWQYKKGESLTIFFLFQNVFKVYYIINCCYSITRNCLPGRESIYGISILEKTVNLTVFLT